MPIAFHRFVVVGLLLVAASAGCADEQVATPEPVRERSAPTLATTTAPPPPPTKPLVTAPPSPLLDEVVAAYDAAYADLLAAEAIPDENYPALSDHVGEGQLEKWKSVIRELAAANERVRRVDEGRWRRIEAIVDHGGGDVEITVCRFDPDETVDAAEEVVGASRRAYRYIETLWRVGEVWKWVGRQWIDSAFRSSDCALP